MATRPTEALTTIPKYNLDPYDAGTNPFGFDDGGHIYNHLQSFRYVVQIENWINDLAIEVDTDAKAAAADRVATGQDRTAAAQSATNAAASAARLQGTSTTSRAPAVGSLSFTTQADKAFDVGAWLTVQSRGTPNRWAYGKVTAYNASTGALTIAAEAIGSVVTAGTDWNILVVGARGTAGLDAPESWGTLEVWAIGVAYTATAPRSVVSFDGGTYVCIAAHTSSASITPADTSRWRQVAAKGEPAPAVDISGKMDKAGGAFTGHVDFIAGTSDFSPISIPPGSAPGSPANGDIWTTTTGVFHRRGGVSRMFLDNTANSISDTLLASMGAGTVKANLGSAGGPSNVTFAALLAALGATLNSTSGIATIPLTRSGVTINLVIQWGTITGTGDVQVSFPAQFPNAVPIAFATMDLQSSSPGLISYTTAIRGVTASGMTVMKRSVQSGSANQVANDGNLARWFAIGF